MARGHAYLGALGVHGQGACIPADMCGQGGLCGRRRGMCWLGTYVGGVHGRGCVWSTGMCMPRGCVCLGGHAPPARYHDIWSVNERAVRILLECILVLQLIFTGPGGMAPYPPPHRSATGYCHLWDCLVNPGTAVVFVIMKNIQQQIGYLHLDSMQLD